MGDRFESEALMARCGQKRDLVLKLIELVRQDVPVQLQKIELGLENKDFTDVVMASHKIKGTSLNLCLPKLKEAAENMENMSRSAQNITPILLEQYKKIKEEWDWVDPQLAAF